ncbi:MAG: thermonuclease family protein [Sulfuricaulis sp.]|uniref:thermonuclease family protein n=1 Tax=Sulfuricaulis sp. TaxID=2003553 RepID=UPI0025F311C1|nr:thermonuclease family protein [Sulfuricaulis sp.]MCR4347830.1 thermonuclease family protein [Sulfuricaulis sp.]
MSAFLFSGILVSTASVADETVAVRHVLDGDSFVLADDRQVRLIGINAPEFGKDGAPNQPLARTARERLVNLIEKKRVALVFEQERQDHYGRLLARVRLADGSDAGERLLREGLAWAIAIPPNLEKLSANLAAENEARAALRGVWNEPAYTPKPADSLTRRDTGFLLIEGKILRHGQGRHLMYFDLSPNLTLTVPRADWNKYFTGKPSVWVGRRIIARGWVTESKGRLRLRVAHPAMLTWRD